MADKIVCDSIARFMHKTPHADGNSLSVFYSPSLLSNACTKANHLSFTYHERSTVVESKLRSSHVQHY